MFARSSVFESSVERAAAPAVNISKLGNAAMMQSLLASGGGKGGGGGDGGGVGEAIDGAKLLMERIITVIQIAAIIYALYKVMEMDRMIKEKIEDLKREWKEGWERHNEAMAELKQEWEEGWKRHDEAVEELKQRVHEDWKEGWERHNEAMEKMGELMPDKLTDFIAQGKKRQADAMEKLKDHFKL